MRLPSNRLRVLLLVIVVLLAACGDDDGAAVRDLGADGEQSASASAPASGSGAASGSGSASAPAEGDKPCSPVAPELEDQARERISITAHEYAFTPAEVATSAGIVTFDVVNDGKQPHELAFLPGGGDVPFTDGEPDEAALEKAGAFELEAFGPGQTCAATYDLAPGTYTLFCIVKSPDGTTHYQQGMRGTLTVS